MQRSGVCLIQNIGTQHELFTGLDLAGAMHDAMLKQQRPAAPRRDAGVELDKVGRATREILIEIEDEGQHAAHAAGELDDPEAVAVFGDLLASSDSSRESWYAAAWSLARSSAPAAAEHMRRFAVPEQEGLIATLACAALARTGTPGSAGDLPRVSRMAAQTSHALQRRVCSFAEAALTPDDQLDRMYDRLQAADPTLAAIAAWRIGQVDRERRPRAAVAALLRRYVGVPGLARDASAAALARQLGPGGPGVMGVMGVMGGPGGPGGLSSAPIRVAPLPPVRKSGWEITVERWLTGVIAPDYTPLGADALMPFRVELGQALAAAQTGPRAEAQSAKALQTAAQCPLGPQAPEPACLDLRPLVRPSVPAERVGAPGSPDSSMAAKPRATR